MRAKALLIVAPEPPPYYGAAVVTGRLLRAGRRGAFRFRHVDTMDPVGTANMGRVAWDNLALAARHYAATLRILLAGRDVGAVYLLGNFTNVPAFLRDAGLVGLARLFGKPVILHCHDNQVEAFARAGGPLLRALARHALESCARVVVLCDGIAGATRRVAPHARVHVVQNGLDLEPIGARDHAPPEGGARAVPRVLFLSQLSEEKGFRTALRVAAHIQEAGIPAAFDFAGSWRAPGDAERAARWVAEHGLEQTARVWGPVSEERKFELLRAADVFLFPTELRHEGQPLVLLEAMAARLPVVTTDVGCIGDTVRSGEDGFVLPVGDVGGIADGLANLLQDPAARGRMGAAAGEHYRATYTEERFVERMMDLLREVAPEILPDVHAAPVAAEPA